LHISNKKIAVIGSGSWATALVKILQNTQNNIGWWIRNPETANHIKNFGHNPRYLNTVQFNLDKLSILTNINEVIKQ